MANSRSGMSIVEVVVSLLVIALMAAAGLNAAGHGARTRLAAEERASAQVLASSLLTEILSQPYRESPTALGPDAGETTTDRATFDDVDDYSSYTQSPPASVDGTLLASASWRWKVDVAWVTGPSLSSSAFETGRKRVTVTVTHNSRTVAEVSGFCSYIFEESFQ